MFENLFIYSDCHIVVWQPKRVVKAKEPSVGIFGFLDLNGI